MDLQLLIEVIADGAVVPVVLIGAYALIVKVPNAQKYQTYVAVLIAGLTSFLVAKLMGTVFQPELQRPFEQLGVDPGASFLPNPGFPSDHVLFTAAITFAVWFATRDKRLTIILAALTIIVGIGRVLALVHTPLDVIGGLLAAAIGSLWYLQLLPAHSEHVLQNKQKKGTL